MPNFGFAPFAAYYEIERILTTLAVPVALIGTLTGLDSRTNRVLYEPMSSALTGYSSPYRGTVMQPTNYEKKSYHIDYMTTGQVHRRIKPIAFTEQ